MVHDHRTPPIRLVMISGFASWAHVRPPGEHPARVYRLVCDPFISRCLSLYIWRHLDHLTVATPLCQNCRPFSMHAAVKDRIRENNNQIIVYFSPILVDDGKWFTLNPWWILAPCPSRDADDLRLRGGRCSYRLNNAWWVPACSSGVNKPCAASRNRGGMHDLWPKPYRKVM